MTQADNQPYVNPAQIADGVRHDEGVRCVALDGHHRLQRLHWGWDCSVCGAVLRLGVWHPKPDVKTLMDHLEESLAAAKAAFKAEQSDGEAIA